MADKKVIAVLGATGAQGGGLVRAILADKSRNFTVRALTRNVNSDKAKSLAELGAEVVAVDIDNYDSIKNAFAGAYGVYAVTFFWEHFSPEKETAQVAAIAKAAKETNVQHVVWSTLEDTRKWVPLEDNRMPTLMGKYKVPHLDCKGEADKFFTEQGVPTTNLLTSFYWENFIYFGMAPKKGEDGKFALSLPVGDKKLAGIAADDIGKSAYEIFKNRNEYIGKTVGISGEQLTGKQMADMFTKSLGQEVTYNDVPFDVYRGLGFPGAEDLGNMFQFFHDFENDFCGVRNVEKSKSINPSMQNFESWLEANKSKIPFE
ncbi:MAG: NmrA/HSCARG family protein [Ignavibacteriaceae bacterium]|nr:NmrA/HSCARG family protein [Ignavibacteria bacterium]MBT8392496.1 NmrA/HSCARG family protein [Ignavibacteria bacterium]NNJ53573.1 NmrA/HSCARG family protein [Ignavibacteriaceae bacterium]NNL22075.1 NmrA/HSCARG family protein [Ignavibacteriaceae bacterium]